MPSTDDWRFSLKIMNCKVILTEDPVYRTNLIEYQYLHNLQPSNTPLVTWYRNLVCDVIV